MAQPVVFLKTKSVCWSWRCGGGGSGRGVRQVCWREEGGASDLKVMLACAGGRLIAFVPAALIVFLGVMGAMWTNDCMRVAK